MTSMLRCGYTLQDSIGWDGSTKIPEKPCSMLQRHLAGFEFSFFSTQDPHFEAKVLELPYPSLPLWTKAIDSGMNRTGVAFEA